jgi:hypothetical protein
LFLNIFLGLFGFLEADFEVFGLFLLAAYPRGYNFVAVPGLEDELDGGLLGADEVGVESDEVDQPKHGSD